MKNKLIVCGYSGKTGKALINLIESNNNWEMAAGFARKKHDDVSFPVYDVIDCNDDANIIIDFSAPEALEPLLDFAVKRKLPLVIVSTGHTKQQVAKIKEASKHIPIFYSPAISIGINLISYFAQKAATFLGNDFDIEIIEKHHNQKLDAPSGMALVIADEISNAMNTDYTYVYDRHNEKKIRDKKEIGILSMRGGNIVGEHEIIFAGNNEVVSLKHQTASRNVFASGALRAAEFLLKQQPGIYSMKDLIKVIFD